MKQITPEIKSRIHALYWGQDIAFCAITKNNLTKRVIGYGLTDPGSKHIRYIEVKPLSSITDEDAAELNAMRNWTKGVHGTKHWYQDEADYLRSKGYALPAFGYSVDELVGWGVFKLKED